MKQFVSKVRNLSQKAAEIKAAMQQLPPKVAEVREAVASTAGQLQQLRVDVQSTMTGLKADNEQRISQAMQEISGSLDVFLAAGFDLGGLDLEISPVHRVLVHLNKREDVHPSVIRALISANPHRKTTHALLNSLLQAQEMAATVDLANLDYAELIVGVGPIPSVRICWRAAEAAEAQPVEPPAQTIPAAPQPAASPAAAHSVFGQSSFFEKRPPQLAPAPAQTIAATAPAIQVSTPVATPAEALAVTEAAHGPAPGGKPDPLARFKKMPDLSKYKR